MCHKHGENCHIIMRFMDFMDLSSSTTALILLTIASDELPGNTPPICMNTLEMDRCRNNEWVTGLCTGNVIATEGVDFVTEHVVVVLCSLKL